MFLVPTVPETAAWSLGAFYFFRFVCQRWETILFAKFWLVGWLVRLGNVYGLSVGYGFIFHFIGFNLSATTVKLFSMSVSSGSLPKTNSLKLPA